MIRQMIEINKELCDGCGLCVTACHEGALGIIDGKAVLLRDDYCDGLGNCLPICPQNAIKFIEREAAPFNKDEVEKNMEKSLPCGCPSTKTMSLNRNNIKASVKEIEIESQLLNWPIQIKLVPTTAPYLNNCNLLIAADCTAYAYANFHNDFIKNKITLIGCPKLDNIDYSNKLTDILVNNEIKNVTIIRMEVPCCSGIVSYFKNALVNSKKVIPWQVITISTTGEILE